MCAAGEISADLVTAMRTLLIALLCVLAACSPQVSAPSANPKLDKLFAQLAAAGNSADASVIEKKIWAIWGESGSPTVDILLERAQAAEAAGDLPRARSLLDKAADILPDYAEIYDRRAVLAVHAENSDSALADINETLKREPRHFAALAALGMIYENQGHKKAAIAAYEDALKIDPFLDEAKQGVGRLKPKVEGQGA